MAVRTEQLPGGAHPVDIGAPYFTVRSDDFGQVVQSWAAAGLARPWTGTSLGETPARWTAALGMRSLVQDLARGLDVRLEHAVQQVSADGTVDGEQAAAVVLAMPDPQAQRLLTGDLATSLGVADRSWAPALSVWSAWEQRCWPEFGATFVNESQVLSWVSDDGRSRGDGAPVLVAHTTGDFAQGFLDDPERAAPAVLSELPLVLGASLPPPVWTRVHRWSLASTRQPHDQPFKLGGEHVPIGVCGDAWGERSRVEQAWVSGDQLASALLDRLTVS